MKKIKTIKTIKTIKWVLSFLVFLAVGLWLFGGVANTLRKKVGGSSDMIHSFYALEKDSIDVLCLGSSHGYSAMQANTFWGEYGIPSYVMCSHRQTIVQSYYLLREALKYQKPKIVVMEGYYFWCDIAYTDESSFRYAFDALRFSPLKVEIIENLLQDLPFKERLTYYIPFLKYHSRWNELQDTDFNRDLYLKGSLLDFNIQAFEEPELPESGEELPDTFYEYFEKIRTICEEEGIQLVVYTAPYGYKDKEENFRKKQALNYTLAEYLEGLEIPFFFYQKTNEAGIDYQTDFRDYDHMNTRGAEKITRHLGAFLMENYELQDHREEAAYQSWNEDYQKYLAAVQEELGEE